MIVHLRAPSPTGNGTTKDWIISHNPGGDGLLIQYGTTGKTLRRTVIPASACAGGVQREMEKRIEEKLAKGYSEVNVGSEAKVTEMVAEKERTKRLAAAKVAAAEAPEWF